MSKRLALMLTILSLATAIPRAAQAQAPAAAEPQTYTFVIQRTIPRSQWAEWETFNEQKYRPVLEKLMADGLIVSWGMFTTLVHVDGYPTHGSWIEAADLASIYKALAELDKLPSPTHRDYLLHSQLRHARPASGTNGYLWVNNTHLQPGKGGQYRGLYERFVKPLLDELVGNGAMVLYAMQNETIHTEDPSQIFDVYFFAGPEGQDKLYAALGDMEKKNTFFSDALDATEVGPPHRDYLARVTRYAVK